MRLRAGPYIDLPAGDAFATLARDVRSLTGLLHDLAGTARGELVILVPFLTAPVLDDWLHIWTSKQTDLRIVVIHRQVPNSPQQRDDLRRVMLSWRERCADRISFRTFPSRAPNGELLPGPTFHCKLIDPGTGHIVMMSSNLNEHARTRNAEVGYVLGPREGGDLRRFLAIVRHVSVQDPLAEL